METEEEIWKVLATCKKFRPFEWLFLRTKTPPQRQGHEIWEPSVKCERTNLILPYVSAPTTKKVLPTPTHHCFFIIFGRIARHNHLSIWFVPYLQVKGIVYWCVLELFGGSVNFAHNVLVFRKAFRTLVTCFSGCRLEALIVEWAPAQKMYSSVLIEFRFGH